MTEENTKRSGFLKELTFDPPIVAIDYDGTIAQGSYPSLGWVNHEAIEAISILKSAGWRVVIWTCREDNYLADVKYLFRNLEIDIDAFNSNDAITKEEWGELGFSDTRKIGYDVLIDDKSLFYQDDWELIMERLLAIYDNRE